MLPTQPQAQPPVPGQPGSDELDNAIAGVLSQLCPSPGSVTTPQQLVASLFQTFAQDPNRDHIIARTNEGTFAEGLAARGYQHQGTQITRAA